MTFEKVNKQCGANEVVTESGGERAVPPLYLVGIWEQKTSSVGLWVVVAVLTLIDLLILYLILAGRPG